MRWLWLIFLLVGCQSSPPPLNAQEMAKDILNNRIYVTPAVAREIHAQQIAQLLMKGDYARLDKYMDGLSQGDPYDNFCSPCAALEQALSGWARTANYPNLFLTHHMCDNWAATGSTWGKVAGIVADWARYLAYIQADKYLHQVSYYQGISYRDQALQKLAQIPKDHPAWSYLDLFQTLGKQEHDQWAPGLIANAQKHPQEVMGFRYLREYIQASDKTRQHDILAQVLAKDDQCYALLFTCLTSRLSQVRFAVEGWDGPALQAGFGKLLKAHSNSLELRNAQALAAVYSQSPDEATTLKKELGYHWSPEAWQGLSNYQKVGGDFHLGDTRLPSLTVGSEAQAAAFAPGSNQGLQLQVGELLAQGQFAVLDALLDSLRQKNPEQLARAYGWLTNIEAETEPAYQVHLEPLQRWKEARPDSLAADFLLGDFFIHYAWLARGSGTSDTVTPEGWKLFKSRLDQSATYCRRAYGKGCRDSDLVSNLIVLCRAQSSDKKLAKKLTLEALRRGPGWERVLRSYAIMLLPRWLGQPGEWQREADDLRKQLGHDDAYLAMGMAVLEADGEKALKPAQPDRVDWKRLASAARDSVARKTLSSDWAQEYLLTCEAFEKPVDARIVLGSLGDYWSLAKWDSSYHYQATPRWAMGQQSWYFGGGDMRFGPAGFFTNGKFVAGNQGKLSKGVCFGFVADAPKLPKGRFLTYRVKFTCPMITTDDGSHYKRGSMTMEIYPDQPPTSFCGLVLEENFEMMPGEWTVTFLDHQGVPQHTATFQLLP